MAGKDVLAAAGEYQSAARVFPWRSDLKEKAALAYASSKDWTRAMPLFEAARRQRGLTARGWDMLGRGYWSSSQDEQALDTWSAGLRQYPDELMFYGRLALAYRALHDLEGERSALEIWIGAGQGTALDHYRLAELLMATDPDRAREELQKASTMDETFAPVARTLDASLKLAAQAPRPAQQRVIVGRGLALVNEWELAERAFESATQADAKDAEAWAWLGEARQQMGKDGKRELDMALSLGPRDRLVHALRGLYWKRQGKYPAVLAEYRTLAQLEPTNPEWQVGLGEAYTWNGDLVSALAAYQKATSLAPTSATYWRLLAIFCADNGVQVAEVGLPAARKAAELAPDDAKALDALGWSYAQAGLLYNAEQALTKAVKLDPGFALAHIHLAETYLRAGKQNGALQELTIARELDPNSALGVLAGQLIHQYFP